MTTKVWRVWAHFWTSPKPRKWNDYATKEEADQAAEALNCSPAGEFTSYFVEALDRKEAK